jgi:hypothetical protein
MKIQLGDGRTVEVPVNKADSSVLHLKISQWLWGNTRDFEPGDLRGWTATGNAFAYQPTFLSSETRTPIG